MEKQGYRKAAILSEDLLQSSHLTIDGQTHHKRIQLLARRESIQSVLTQPIQFQQYKIKIKKSCICN
ncbi:MAG TPA: hypothetical protein DD622_04525, partial [Opitutae bacterium]|nr:hypothetical protein [Opitutae bacterium]